MLLSSVAVPSLKLHAILYSIPRGEGVILTGGTNCNVAIYLLDLNAFRSILTPFASSEYYITISA